MALLMTILAGICIGMLFGFLLQKGSVSNFNTIVGQFLFADFTVLKVMLSAILVGGVMIYGLVAFEYIPALPAKVSSSIGSALGGALFGCGMALLGYCPGTALAALGQGAKDAFFGILGMFCGVLIFERMYLFLKTHVVIDLPTNITLAQLCNVSPFFIFAVIAVFAIILVAVLRRYSL